MTQRQAIGPHGGPIVENEENRFEVKLDTEKKRVQVYTLRSKKPPKKVSVILYQNSTHGDTIELQAVDPSEALPRYEGQLSVANTPYVGVAVQISAFP